MSQFTVIIPTFNRARLVERAINSALNQTHRPSQIIVVDDGSTDNTTEVCAKYSGVIQYVRQSNAGVSAARNHGVRLARFAWTAFLDSDDYWVPNHLEKIATAIEATSGRGRFYFTNMQLPGGNQNETLWSKIGLKFSEPYLFIQDGTPWMLISWQPCSLQCVVFNTNILKLSGLFDPRFRIREDTELFCRLGIGGEICLVNNIGCIQTADDSPENRLSETFHTRTETYWQLECLLCRSLLSRFPDLKPYYKRILRHYLAIAHWRLARLYWRSGRFSSSMMTFFRALAEEPAFLKEVFRSRTEGQGSWPAGHLHVEHFREASTP
jgi:glycosyltransferase involved in cell wall biosynthesis